MSRLKAKWADECEQWNKRDLSASRWIYWWADGIHTQVRTEDSDGQCLVVVIGVKPNGEKERVALSDGYRESKASWIELLLDLKARGLQAQPLLVVGDGAMGLSAALEEVCPQVRHQRCWLHKIGNILNVMPKLQQSKVKSVLGEIWNATTRADAIVTFNQSNTVRYLKVVEKKLVKDRDEPLAFYDVPVEHGQHVPTTNPIESTFATARHRMSRTRNCLSRTTFLSKAFKLIETAEQSWEKIRGVDKIDSILKRSPFKDGTLVTESTPAHQALTT